MQLLNKVRQRRAAKIIYQRRPAPTAFSKSHECGKLRQEPEQRVKELFLHALGISPRLLCIHVTRERKQAEEEGKGPNICTYTAKCVLHYKTRLSSNVCILLRCLMHIIRSVAA